MLSTRTIILRDVNWLGGDETECAVKVRSMRPPVPARLSRAPDRSAEVTLLDPEEAVAPGQACVFYERDGTRVLGGGWIAKAEPARAAA
jgi:tRNA-specific 2-thiouridylase